MRALRLAAAAAALAACAPACAAVLYKSVSPEGVMQFSDRPPESGKVLAAIPLDSPPAQANVPALAASPAGADTPQRAIDAAVDRASEKLDLAEHALAEARRTVWSEPDPLQIRARPMTRADRERIAWYEKDVRRARLALADAMRRRMKADLAVTLTASNEWQPFRPADRR